LARAEPLPLRTPSARAGEQTIPAQNLPARGTAAGWPGARSFGFRPPRGTAVVLALIVALAAAGLWELRTFSLEAELFSRAARDADFRVVAGAASRELPPPTGPFDRRLGYDRLRERAALLSAQGFGVVAQAEPSEPLARIADLGLFPPYTEKTQTGLLITGRAGATLFAAREPARRYDRFEAIPPLLADTLLFIENRELLDADAPRRNPAIEWDRLARATLWNAAGLDGPGASTLATQIEKYRHSVDGVTASPAEKLRQMISASLRAYRGGPDTAAERHRIVLDYLNTVPLAAVAGRGEVFGIGDGLAAWYGASFDEMNTLLAAPLDLGEANRDDAARAYLQALSLLVAQRRPTTLLVEHPESLMAQTRAYLPLLAEAGVIPGSLRDAALAQHTLPVGTPPPDDPEDADVRRRAGPVRARLAGLLGTRGFYELDRLDLRVDSTLDVRAQDLLTERIERLREPGVAAAAGLVGTRLLQPGAAEGVTFSLNLYERGPDAHRLLAQVDNFDGALDLNDGMKLDLGSTAKLRTLVTYLELIAGIRDQLLAVPADQRAGLVFAPSDRLGRWVRDELLARPDLSLDDLLQDALERRYSASPYASFFTGGGIHRFNNFDESEDTRIYSVREALEHSVNLAFVRVLDDVVDHLMSADFQADEILAAPSEDPRRRAYLWNFAHWEGSRVISRAHARFAGLAPAEAVAKLYAGKRPTPRAASAALRAIDPTADFATFARSLAALRPDLEAPPATIAALYAQSDPARWTWQDRGYLARMNPLELWLLGYLREHPEATVAEALEESRDVRIDSYQWLFRTSRRHAQNRRIRTMIEREAFDRIHTQWQATGYPFPSLVPSLATALGSSADRPTALAELIGILASDGVRLPIRRIESLHFAEGTPYEMQLAPSPTAPVQVLRPEVCAAVREVLVATVEQGTAVRARGALKHADGTLAVVGGKTGTGDNRIKIVARDARVLDERPVSRSATFVFLIDDRFFGVVTALVTGPEAGHHTFTSSLPVQLFADLLGEVLPALEESGAPAEVAQAGSR